MLNPGTVNELICTYLHPLYYKLTLIWTDLSKKALILWFSKKLEKARVLDFFKKKLELSVEFLLELARNVLFKLELARYSRIWYSYEP